MSNAGEQSAGEDHHSFRKCVEEMAKAETRHQRRGDAFQESDELYRTLIETSPDPIIVYSLKGELITANKQVAETYGAPKVADLLSEITMKRS